MPTTPQSAEESKVFAFTRGMLDFFNLQKYVSSELYRQYANDLVS